MRKCINCGKELNDNMSFCPECGTAQNEQEGNLSEKTIPYIDEIINRHLKHIPNKLETEVETCILSSINVHVYELYIISNTETPLRIKVLFKKSSKREREALERFKEREYFSLFTTDLTYIDGYSGYLDFADNIAFAKKILSSLFLDVYMLQETACPSMGYSIKIGGNSIGRYDIKDGVHVKNKGCLSIVIALIVMSATLFSFI